MNKAIKVLLLFAVLFVMLTGCSQVDEALSNVDNSIYDTANSIDESKAATDTLASGDLKVHFIDVGQADSILIQVGNEFMLIDAGKNEDGTKVVDYLEQVGVEKLKYVIGTHPHEDHIGGLDVVINHFDIDKVILPEYTLSTKTFKDVLSAIDNKDLKITLPKLGKTYSLGDGTFTIIAPVKQDYGDNPNNYSVGIKFTYGKTSFVSIGDAELAVEKDVLEQNFDLEADLYKVSHHGSDTSNSDEFLKAIDPIYAVISVGANNSYGHPNSNVVTTLLEDDVQIYRTDKNGTVIATSDGTDFTFKTLGETETRKKEDVSEVTSSKENVTTRETTDTVVIGADENVYRTKTGSKYHRDGCKSLSKSKIEITRKEAIDSNLDACEICNP